MSDSAAFVPGDFAVPGELVTDSFRLVPLGPEHNDGDYRAWMASIGHIRSRPGFGGRSWPRPEKRPAQSLADVRPHAADVPPRPRVTYTDLAARDTYT